MKEEKSCGCIVIDNEKVLLVKHILGHWDLSKGHMEKEETEVQTAIREVKEETNIDVEIKENYRYTLGYNPEKKILKKVVYFIATPKTSDVRPQESEIQEVKWFEFSEALERVTFDNVRELLKEVKEDFFME